MKKSIIMGIIPIIVLMQQIYLPVDITSIPILIVLDGISLLIGGVFFVTNIVIWLNRLFLLFNIDRRKKGAPSKGEAAISFVSTVIFLLLIKLLT